MTDRIQHLEDRPDVRKITEYMHDVDRGRVKLEMWVDVDTFVQLYQRVGLSPSAEQDFLKENSLLYRETVCNEHMKFSSVE